MLPIHGLLRDALESQLAAHREDFRREQPRSTDIDFYKEVVPFFHEAWISAIVDPPIPHLRNTDGEDMLPTRTRYEVLDRQGLERALDAAGGLERNPPEEAAWSWSGLNVQGEQISLGRLVLEGSALVLETNSVERDRRGRDMLEGLAAGKVRLLGTVHEDLEQQLREVLRSGPPEDRQDDGPGHPLPLEVEEDLVLDQLARHYRQWLDMEIPKLDGRTPRQAAKDPRLAQRLAGMIRDLEGDYHRALRQDRPAYDPSWLWAELGLASPGDVDHPPPLAHERWAEAVPGLGDLCAGLAKRTRGLPGFDDGASVITMEQLEEDLEVRRFLRGRPGRPPRLKAKAAPGAGPAGDTLDQVTRWLLCLANLELHRRKLFWVDEALAFMLAQTDLDARGHDLRVPFPSFGVAFTNREVLSLGERLLAKEPACPLAGHFLRVITAYVTEQRAGGDRVLHISFAMDALGADPPYLLEHELALYDDAPVELPGTGEDGPVLVNGEELKPALRPLPGLLHVTLNAVLYATSAGVEPCLRRSPPNREPSPPGQRPGEPVFSSEDVFFLPGAIEISRLRQMQSLLRGPSGRKQMVRFMVRGHWRRPAAAWKDRRMRWIKPYWKGPDLAAVIERTYKLKP